MPKSTHISNEIYMDHASAAFMQSANPGAIHKFGIIEKNKLENSRKKIADILSAHTNEIIFTSGATESNNLAILGLIRNFKKSHIVTTNIEHASVLEVCKHLEKTKQAEVTYVPVEDSGIVDPKKIKKALKKNTVLVSVMYANNEIGTIQPIREIAKEIRHWNKQNRRKQNFFRSSVSRVPLPVRPFKNSLSPVLLHTDATQAINYLPVGVLQLGVDMMSFNSAKIYGPKGVGVLYIKKGTTVTPIMFGGNQEMGLRPGTENVALATSIAEAMQATEKIKDKEVKRLIKLRDYFFTRLTKMSKGAFDITINGDLKNRLPNNINITIPKIPSDLLVIELSAKGIMASSKSACKAGDGKASHVIEAIRKITTPPACTPPRKGGEDTEVDGSLRFSLGRETTKKDIDYTVKAFAQILQKLKKWYD